MIKLNELIINIIVFIIGFLLGWILNNIIEKFLREDIVDENQENSHIIHKPLNKRIFVQIISGVVTVFLYNKYKITAELFFFVYIMFVLIVMFFVDLKIKIIPNELVIAGFIGGIAAFFYNMIYPLSIYPSIRWWEPLVGILPGSGILFLVALLGAIIYKSDDVMGMGDVKIFAPIGLFLGWKMCILTLVMSVFLGGTTSMILILFKIKNRKDTIPFGPFIAIAVLMVILFGKDIWSWYFSWT